MDERTARRGAGARTGKSGERLGPSPVERMREAKLKRLKKVDHRFRKEAMRQGRCRNPDCKSRDNLTAHHIVAKTVVFEHPLRDAKANCMALCNKCHMQLNKGKLVVERTWLYVREIQMVEKLMGRRWLDERFPVR